MKTESASSELHPATWWILAVSLATLASATRELWLLATIVGASVLAAALGERKARVASGQQVASSGRISGLGSLKFLLWFAGAIVVFRVLFRVIFNVSASSGLDPTGVILLDLPRLEVSTGFGLPISLFGEVSGSSLLAGFTDGMRLAAIVLAIGAANVLVNPRRLLNQLPALLYEVASAVALAVNLTPQLIRSIQRIQRARQIRGRSGRMSLVSGTIIPVLEDTMARSLALAASMDSRGFGFSASKGGARLTVRLLALVAVLLLLIGSFLLLTGAGLASQLLLVLGGLILFSALLVGSRQSVRTRLRVTRLRATDIALMLLSGLFVLLGLLGVVS